MIRILDKDLESVIEQAAKLQNKVLESIIGERSCELAYERTEGTAESLREPSEIMNAAENQLKIHQSEKVTFSKGIASIIYNKSEEEQNLVIGNNGQERQSSEEKIYLANESIVVQEEKLETESLTHEVSVNFYINFF